MNINTATIPPELAAPPSQPLSLSELILSMEQATLMAKQLPTTTDPNNLLQIYSSLHQTRHHLSSFLSQFSPPPPKPPPPQPPIENSLSSATEAAEPMQVGDDENDDHEENSKATTNIDKVEERMRDFSFVKHKRLKRQLSPSSAAEEGRLIEDGFGGRGGVDGFDPYGTRLRALELIYQFHS